MSWTDEKIARLRELAAEKLSASTIALRINTEFRGFGKLLSRNAVIGKLARIKTALSSPHAVALRTHKENPPLPKPPRVAKPQKAAAAPKKKTQQNRFIRLKQPKLKPEPIPMTPVAHNFLGIAFMDLKEGMCRYPQGDAPPFLFCGQPQVRGSSYCEHCKAICESSPRRSQTFDDAEAARRRGWARKFFRVNERAI